jgi:Mg-chelatase subunit ChlD
VQFVEDMIADGNTNIHDALELAFHIVGMGARDKNYEIGADTIFFLSDGIPNRGKITDPVMILEEVKRWNQLRRVKIHAVGVGSDHQAAFMKALADASGGTYVSR